jgi:hypothetical protein
MAVLNPRTVLTLAAGIGIGAAIAHRRAAASAAQAEPCCEQPAHGASCC